MGTLEDVIMTIKSYIFTCIFILLSPVISAKPVLLDSVAAIVNEDVIMQSQLDERLAQIKKQNAAKTLPSDKRLRQKILERLISTQIQLQMAQRAGIKISDAQLNDAIERIAKSNKLSVNQFRKNIERNGTSFAQAREQIRNEMAISQVQRFQVGERINITKEDIDQFMLSNLGKISSQGEYHLRHLLIAIPSAATEDQIKKAQNKAQNIYQKVQQGADFRKLVLAESDGRNALKGGDLGWRKEQQLPSIFAEIVPKLKVGEVSQPIKSGSGFHLIKLLEKRGGSSNQLVTQYNTRHILVKPTQIKTNRQAKSEIDTLYKKLKVGESFSKLAKEHSDDPGSGSRGGSLGWVSPKQMVPEFDKTMQQMPKGEISKPFKTQFGWHILQVQDIRETDISEELKRNKIHQLLYNRRFEDELPIWLRRIRSEAFVDIKIDEMP